MAQEQLNPQQVRQLASRSKKESLENNFLSHWVLMYPQLPEPVRQHPIRNHKTGRFWKLDFAWVEEKLGVEIQGGSYVQGRHNNPLGQAADYDRHNELTRLGWQMIYFNTLNLRNIHDVVTTVAEILCRAD